MAGGAGTAGVPGTGAAPPRPGAGVVPAGTLSMIEPPVRAGPPTFVIAVNDPDGVHFSYRRYLTNQFRDAFGFGGAPIRLLFRKRKQDAKRAR